MPANPKNITFLLPLILNGEATNAQINEVVRIAHHFAVIRLKQLIGSGKLHLQSFPLSVDSIAFDCIADIFERDGDGAFVELVQYFSDERDPLHSDGTALIIAFRSLIFTKLHDGIFRLYRENDPVFSKILRNVKIALMKSHELTTFERFGLIFVDLDPDDRYHSHLPEYPLEALEQMVTGGYKKGDSTAQFLQLLKRIVIGQNEYRRSVSLFDCTLLLKRASAFHHVPLDDIFSADENLLGQDINSIVVNTLRFIRNDLTKRYVLSGKITQQEFKNYFSAIEEMIMDTFVRSDGSERTYDQYLQQFIRGLSYEEYRSIHRVRFEYMTKMVKKAVKDRLKELL